MTGKVNIKVINELILSIDEIEEEKNVIKKDDTEIDVENNSRDINHDYFDNNQNEIKIYNSINTDWKNNHKDSNSENDKKKN